LTPLLMNFRFIAQDTFKAALAFAGMGAVLGVIAAGFKEHGRCTHRQKMKVNMPPMLLGMDMVRESLDVLSNVKRVNFESFERVIRRCNTLVELNVAVATADSSTVKLAVATAATQMFDSVRRYLLKYYYECDVLLAKDQDGRCPRHLVPVNRDLRAAHDTLIECMEAVTFNIHLLVKEKVEGRQERKETDIHARIREKMDAARTSSKSRDTVPLLEF